MEGIDSSIIRKYLKSHHVLSRGSCDLRCLHLSVSEEESVLLFLVYLNSCEINRNVHTRRKSISGGALHNTYHIIHCVELTTALLVVYILHLLGNPR